MAQCCAITLKTTYHSILKSAECAADPTSMRTVPLVRDLEQPSSSLHLFVVIKTRRDAGRSNS
jgi:hypothetical protein